jgi:hypothetical protein
LLGRGWRDWDKPNDDDLVLMLCPRVDYDNVPSPDDPFANEEEE